MFGTVGSGEKGASWTFSAYQHQPYQQQHHHLHCAKILSCAFRNGGSSSLYRRASFPKTANFTAPVKYDQFTPEATKADHSEKIQGYAYEEAAEKQYLFNRIAPMYDNLNDLLSFGLHRVWKRMCVSWSRVAKDNTVLDLCCGSGDIAMMLAQKVGLNGKVVGLDFAKDQLELAKHRENETLLTPCYNIEWRLGDALNLPFEDAIFDAVTVGYGLRNVDDIPKALSEIYRVLKPGSTASILDFNHSTDPSTRALQEWVLDNIVVPIAGNVGAAEEYAYIKKSISRFPTGKEQEMLAVKGRFSLAVHYEIAGGMMGVLVATK